jgi:hypothetical protein
MLTANPENIHFTETENSTSTNEGINELIGLKELESPL